jgi:hypothetical protein
MESFLFLRVLAAWMIQEDRYFTTTLVLHMLDSIHYKNMSFPCRKLHIDGWGNVLISTRELQAQLLDESGTNFRDSVAQMIDEKIFFFVERAQLLMSPKDLSKTLEKELRL